MKITISQEVFVRAIISLGDVYVMPVKESVRAAYNITDYYCDSFNYEEFDVEFASESDCMMFLLRFS